MLILYYIGGGGGGGGGVVTNVARTCDPSPSLHILEIQYVKTNYKKVEPFLFDRFCLS